LCLQPKSFATSRLLRLWILSAATSTVASMSWAVPPIAKLPDLTCTLSRVAPGSGALASATELELTSYPADEAATPEKLAQRAEHAGEYFLGLFGPKEELVGFVCGTTTAGDSLTEETMSTHDAAGTLLCIHSVVVAERYRRCGVAVAMLKTYMTAVAQTGTARAAALIAKKHLVPLYEKSGFDLVGPSEVVHGADPWYELRADLSAGVP